MAEDKKRITKNNVSKNNYLRLVDNDVQWNYRLNFDDKHLALTESFYILSKTLTKPGNLSGFHGFFTVNIKKTPSWSSLNSFMGTSACYL